MVSALLAAYFRGKCKIDQSAQMSRASVDNEREWIDCLHLRWWSNPERLINLPFGFSRDSLVSFVYCSRFSANIVRPILKRKSECVMRAWGLGRFSFNHFFKGEMTFTRGSLSLLASTPPCLCRPIASTSAVQSRTISSWRWTSKSTRPRVASSSSIWTSNAKGSARSAPEVSIQLQ